MTSFRDVIVVFVGSCRLDTEVRRIGAGSTSARPLFAPNGGGHTSAGGHVCGVAAELRLEISLSSVVRKRSRAASVLVLGVSGFKNGATDKGSRCQWPGEEEHAAAHRPGAPRPGLHPLHGRPRRRYPFFVARVKLNDRQFPTR